MGKTKIAIIDDSATAGEKKEAAMVKKPLQKGEDRLVARLKEELGMTEPKRDVVLGSENVPADIREATPESKKDAGQASMTKKEKTKKPGKAKPRSKKYQEVTEGLDRTKTYPLNEALDLVKKLSMTKFTGTLEAHVNTVQTGMRGLVSLPFAAGKTEYERGSKQVYKTEAKTPVIHLGLGKLNQPNEELAANIKALLATLGKSRYKKVTLSPTMGPGVKLDLSSI